MSLPQPKDVSEFNSIDRNNPAFEQFIRNNFAQDLPDKVEIKAFENGSCPTYSISGQKVAKFFPDLFSEDFKNELNALSFTNANHVDSPRVYAEKSLGGWNVILMEQLAGTTLNEVWDNLNFVSKSKLALEAGKLIRKLHSIGSPSSEHRKKWNTFIDEQRTRLFEKQQELKLNNNLLNQLLPFINSVELDDENLVFLHTEAMSDHFMVNKIDAEYSITGIIDFEPAMWGNSEYEFAAVGLFLSVGNKDIFRQFLHGYGVMPDSQFHRRIMAYTILHRYANLPWFMTFMPNENSIEKLAEKWFGV